MRVHRGLLFWGLALITAGAVAFALQEGYLARDTMAGAWRLWPLILVAIGFSLIVSRTSVAVLGTVIAALVVGGIVGTAIGVGPGIWGTCGSGPAVGDLAQHSGSFAGSSASLDWRLNCGRVDVTVASTQDGWSVAAGSTASSQPTVASGDATLRIDSASDSGNVFSDRGDRWIVTLPTATAYAATIHANAGRLNLDLRGGTFSSLDLQPNAADLHLLLDDASITGLDLEMNLGSANLTANAGTSLSGTIQMNLGSVNLCAPSDLPMRITSSGTFFTINLGGAGLTHSGDTWESAGYASATHRITLDVHGNLGSFTLNPSGGC